MTPMGGGKIVVMLQTGRHRLVGVAASDPAVGFKSLSRQRNEIGGS